MIVALASPAGRKVELESNGASHRRDRRFDRAFGQNRATQIGVQYRPREIEHRTKIGPVLFFKAGSGI